jgi:hypothetical protein
MTRFHSSNGTQESERQLSLTQLRDDWIAAENVRTKAYNDFMDANRASPLRKQLDQANEAEKKAKSAYVAALTKTTKDADNGDDGTGTRSKAPNRCGAGLRYRET